MELQYPREMLADFCKDAVESDRETMAQIVDSVFFASLMVDEGAPVRVAIVFDERGCEALAEVTDSQRPEAWGGEPPLAWEVMQMPPIDFTPKELAKLSVGLRYGTHLAVIAGRAPELKIVGVARRFPQTDGGTAWRLAAPRPGVLVFEAGDGEFRYEAGLRVRTINVLRSDGPVRDAIGRITGHCGMGETYSRAEWAIMRLLSGMRATGHGGMLALSQRAPDQRVLSSLKYRASDAAHFMRRIDERWDTFLKSLGARIASADRSISGDEFRRHEELRARRESAAEAELGAIDKIAQLSAIDGALLFGPGLVFYGAGCMLRSGEVARCAEGMDPAGTQRRELQRTFGARHTAALAFADSDVGNVSFVVSEDGPVKCALKIDDTVVVWPMRVPET